MGSPFVRNQAIRKAVVSVMKQGGYYSRVMDSGPDLDRVKSFLRIMAGAEAPLPLLPYQDPTFLPAFPGLDCRPFHDRQGDLVAEYLESAVSLIRDEAVTIRSRALSETKGQVVTDGQWEIYPMWYMGMDIPFLTARVPKLTAILERLPRSAAAHPFAEALLSWQRPGTHLRRHCSVDALRKRYSVGLIVEDFCELRVADRTQHWTQGESLIFEDCFEHEATNGGKDRLVLIVDTWHPDLTPIEIEVLLAGFRKKAVRKILYNYRLSAPLEPFLLEQFDRQETEPRLQKYWDNHAKIEPPIITDWGTWMTTTRFNGAAAGAS